MRNLFVSLLTAAIAFALSASSSTAQEPKGDPEKLLAEALKNIKAKDNIDLRIQAATTLADFGARAEPALADLLDALETNNEDLRLNAAITLAKIGKAAVKPVAKLLDSDNKDTKFYAIWTIGWIGPDGKETIPTMIKLTKDKDDAVRRKAVFALGRLAGDPSKTIDVLVEAFGDEKEDVRQAAGEALSKFGAAAVPALIELLKVKSAGARIQAATSLGDIGSDAKAAVPALRERFLAKDTENVHHYANVLAKIGKAAMPALEAGFKDTRPEVRQASSQAMQQAGAEAVGVLVDALSDKNVEVRRLAAQTLWPMRIGDKSVVIALAYGLTDEDDTVRQHCMNGLAQLGAQAKLGGPKIKDALTDMNPSVRQQAYYLLQQIGEDPRPTLTKALESKDAKVRINTASLMVNVSFDIDKAMPVLVEALKNDDLGLKMQAAFTLAQRRLQTDKVTPIFIDGLKHKAPSVRVQALQGLSLQGNAAIAPRVAEMMRDPDVNVRQHCVYTLQNIRGNPETVVPILAGAFKEGNAGTRVAVLQVAWMFGGKAKDFILDGLKDKDTNVRQQAINAIQNWQGDLTEALPTIVKLMNDKDLGVNRNQLIWLLARAGDPGVPHLGALLKDTDANIRQQAMQVLRNIGPRAVKAMPQIKEAIKDSNANVRLNAMIVLASVGGEPAFLIKNYQEEKDASVRVSILQSLAYSGQQKLALPLLSSAMKDPAVQVRQNTVNLIGFFGNGSKEGFEVFTMGIKDTDSTVRISAAHHANFFGAKSWPHLEESLKSTKDSGLRQAVLQGMLNTQFKSKTAVEPLTDCLKDTNPTVRMWACVILGNIGPDAAAALPRVRELVNDTNPSVQNAARNAVTQIGRDKK